LCIPHFTCNPELNTVVKVFLSCVHDIYLWLDHKIDVNVDVIHCITCLSKAGANLASHFIGKNFDQKLTVKLRKEFKLSKGGQVYDTTDIKDEALRFTVQFLDGCVLRRCRPTKVPVAVVELAAYAKEGKQYNLFLYLLNQFMEDCAGAQPAVPLILVVGIDCIHHLERTEA
jgi:hypothetical protein